MAGKQVADEILQKSALQCDRKMSRTKTTFYGLSAGILATTVSTPFVRASADIDSIKLLASYFKNARNEHGLLSLWQGNTRACLVTAPKVAFRYLLYNRIRGSLYNSKPLTTFGHFIAGSTSSSITEFVFYPFTVIKNNGTNNDGLFRTFSDIVNQRGFRGLYRGALNNTLITLPVDLFHNLTYSCFRNLTKGGFGTFTTASLSSALSTCVTYPCEVIKRVINKQELPESLVDCIRRTVADKGPRGLYEGLTKTLMTRVPYVATELALLEGIQRTIHRIQQRKSEKLALQLRPQKQQEKEREQKKDAPLERSWSWW